jgi:hypothetical protein
LALIKREVTVMIEYEQESRKKKKRKKESTNKWLVIGIVAGIAFLIGAIVLVIVFWIPGEADRVKAKLPNFHDNPGGQQLPGGDRFKPNPNPQGVVENVRAAAMRPERQNELKQIGLFFHAYVTEHNHNPRTDDDFVKYIEREARHIGEAIKDKYYVLNLKAKITGAGVIAYEPLLDRGCHLSVRTDGSVDLLSPEELQNLLKQ